MTATIGAIPDPAQYYVAGVGFASAADAVEIIALIDSCLTALGIGPDQLLAIATHGRKRGSPLLAPIALHYGVPLRLLDDEDLSGDVPGVADAVAAMAGPLCLPKRKSAFATCAIAQCRPGFSLSGFGQPLGLSAASASPTLATSRAGP